MAHANIDTRTPNLNPGQMVVLSENNPDVLRFKPYDYILAEDKSAKYLTTQSPYYNPSAAYQTSTPPAEKIIQSKIDLSAVTVVGYTPNYDSTTKALTYSVILKIDSATSPSGTIGVEARTYVPGS